MSYMKIENLYKNKDILLFQECYAMEKIHGTSTHISYDQSKPSLHFFAGGAKHASFIELFNEAELRTKFTEMGITKCTVFGEGYGGKLQGMSKTYGPNLKFIAFEVKIDNTWLSVPKAESIVKYLGLEFVHYVKIPTTLEAIKEQGYIDSVQAVRNGMGEGHMREGVVLRPLEEFTKNNGNRIIVKFKRDEFKETKNTRELNSEELKVLDNAKEIADEWVTPMRLAHVLDKLPQDIDITKVEMVIKAMFEDIMLESKGEIVCDKAAKKAISSATVKLFKKNYIVHK